MSSLLMNLDNESKKQLAHIGMLACPIIIGTLGLSGLNQSPQLPIQQTLNQQDLLIQQAESNLSKQYQSLLKTLNATNLNPKQIEEPGLEQAAIVNLGIQLQQKITEQIKDPDHPNYRQTIDGAITRALLTNATEMLLASEVEIPNVIKNGEQGIVLSFYSAQRDKQIQLRLPPEMLKVLAQAYTEALVTQAQLSNSQPISTTIQTQKLIQEIQNYADFQLEKSAYEGNDQMVSQLQDLNSQLKQEAQYYVDINGGIYSD